MWSRTFAGLVPGFFAAAGLLAILTWAWPGPWTATLVAGLLAFFPMWTATFVSAYATRTPRRAWIGLSSIAVLSFALVAVLRAASLVQ